MSSAALRLSTSVHDMRVDSHVFPQEAYAASVRRPLGGLTHHVGSEYGQPPPVGLRTTLVVAAVGGSLSLPWLLPSPIPGIRSLDDGLPVAPTEPPGRTAEFSRSDKGG